MDNYKKGKYYTIIVLVVLVVLNLPNAYKGYRKNNTKFLKTFETLSPVSYEEKEENGITYEILNYGPEEGEVTITYQDGQVVDIYVTDYRMQTYKKFHYNVLNEYTDLAKSPDEVEIIRTPEECETLWELLESENFDEIEKDVHNRVCETDAGTYFIS